MSVDVDSCFDSQVPLCVVRQDIQVGLCAPHAHLHPAPARLILVFYRVHSAFGCVCCFVARTFVVDA